MEKQGTCDVFGVRQYVADAALHDAMEDATPWREDREIALVRDLIAMRSAFRALWRAHNPRGNGEAHTAGPWRFGVFPSGESDPARVVSSNPHGQGPEEVARVSQWAGEWEGECIANARLIAAAPDYRAALEDIRDYVNSNGHTDAEIVEKFRARARSALAAAEGRE